MLLVTPAPSASHQIVASRIHSRLAAAVQWTGDAHVVGPGAVVRLSNTQVQPAILVYPSRFSPNLKWVELSEHWLDIEILSRSSRIYDREFKRDAYFALGVREVWLVDRRSRTVEVCRGPGEGDVARDTLCWRAPTIDVMVPISLDEVFAGIG